MFADKLSDHVVQSVIDVLLGQLTLLVENASRLNPIGVPGNTSKVISGQQESEHSQELKQNEAALCYFIAFLRRVAVTKVAQHKFVSSRWLDLFMGIVSLNSKGKEFSYYGVRTRMLTLHLLTFVLPACEDSMLIDTVSLNISFLICHQGVFQYNMI